ncbi:MAG: YciI family protein [Chloroflexi bacterium]|nr:YciI family protein [Chloroflexota bacterium]
MPEYLAIIYRDEARRPEPGSAALDQLMGRYGRLVGEMQQAGVFKGGNALQDIASATTVRVRGGKTLTTDGPFAETKEQLGGYVLLDCKDLDDALQWAARIPDAENGSIELRPIMPTNARIPA